MNILFISPSYKPAYVYGGPIFSVAKLAEVLVIEGVKIKVITTRANGKEELPLKNRTSNLVDGVTVQYFSRWTKDHSHFSPYLLWYLWRNCNNYQVVHIHSWWNLVSIPAVFICWLCGVKPILSPRGMISNYTMQSKAKLVFHRVLGKRLLNQTIIHATALQEVKESRNIGFSGDIFVLPNMIDLPQIENSLNRKEKEFNLKLLFLSRIHHKKGIELLFDSLAKCLFKWHLTIAGKGEENYIQYLKQKAKELELESNIQWIGWVKGEKKIACLNEADLLVLPSYNENFANVVLESLAVGTAVLISDHVGLSEYVQEKNLGWVCEPNVKSIVQKLEEIAKHKEKLSSIKKIAPEIIHHDFNAQRLAKQYLKNYQEFS